ncbi:MAG: metal ABC transporter substrate-binding protein [Christensenellales bacterium]|jgi:ABC-type Zn uptake system ZnuABC Zn-binding protein ZnuA
MKTKRALIVLFALCILLSGCGGEPEKTEADAIERLTVCCSFTPIYALAKPVFEGVPDVTFKCLIQPQDGCLRNYALSEWDLSVLTLADAVILGGRGLESFASDISSMQDAPATVSLMNNMTLYGQDEKLVSGDEEISHLRGANPHYYLSVQGAIEMTNAIAFAMQQMDARYAPLYEKNRAAQEKALSALQDEMEEILLNANAAPVALWHEGLIYIAEEFGLDAAVRIDRESASGLDGGDYENAVSEMRRAGCRVVLIENQAPDPLIRALVRDGFSVAKIDVLSSNDEYIPAMLQNAHAIFDALNKIT